MATIRKTGQADRAKNGVIVILILGTLLMLGDFVYTTLDDAGEFKILETHSNLDCNVVKGVLSSEDITIDRQTGMAFVSSGIRGLGLDKGGAIIGYDLNAKSLKPVNLTSDFKEEFYPHGIGLYKGAGGAASLFVINHRSEKDYVEIFDYAGSKLVHRRSVSNVLMYSPNDIIPVGRDSFYVTNDHGYRSFRGQILEDLLKLAKSYVLYFDGDKLRIVARGLSFANGINLSPDGKTVYVSEVIGKQISVFDRDVKTGALALKNTIYCGTGVDNIDVAEDGSLWVGAHAKLLTFAKHAKNQKLPAPSQVLHITMKNGKYSVDEVYLDDGSTLSASSVAAAYKNEVLIGGVFAPRFLVCEKKMQ